LPEWADPVWFAMLSQKSRYALHAMLYLARKNDSASVAEIAEKAIVPRKFLEQIMGTLKVRGLVTARRGPLGGYSLSKPAASISFAEILRCIDGPLALAPCASLTAFSKCADCVSLEKCEIRPVLMSVRTTTALLLEGMSLAEATGATAVSFK
jgi:Rrf2 family protein